MSLRHGAATMLGVAAADWSRTVVAVLASMPKGFIPTDDTGQIIVTDRGRAGRLLRGDGRATSAGARRSSQRSQRRRAFTRPSVGGGGRNSTRSQRRATNASPIGRQIIAGPARRSCAAIPGASASAYPQVPPTIRIGGRGSRTQRLYQFTLQGTDTEELYRSRRSSQAKLRALPGLLDVTTDLQITSPQLDRRHRPRQGRRARRHRRADRRTRSTARSARARSPRSTRRPTIYR